ncbi:hypothetical protein [Methylobacterium aerolatum]|uniref:Secreted protein n=1 Tax=Methylobacterium aerolatum TaxID=418708 RepID=A0ABU0HUV7_9HYPH|nr:hypothetical protein [Methylobacterium aerolatum]MDQ0446122.1 hypothetical protein [Methylobacterium aerolatum]GJD35158.1 hypothetical protein FMGBMHLM_2066 [Methylobacterium aerolatum]
MAMGRGSSVIMLAGVAWLALGGVIDGHGTAGPTPAAAQGSLTPPAGQPRATAPGGLRGRAARRPHRQGHRHGAHRRHH